jgi:hypothetical protein
VRAVAGPGRWVWGLAGLATVLALTFGGVVIVTQAWSSDPQPAPQVTMTRTLTLVRPVTSLTVQSYGGAIRVTRGPAGRVQVRDTLTYGPPAGGGQPAVTESLSGGHLILDGPACTQVGACMVSFAVTVPPGVAVTAMTDGGSLTVSGTGAANLDSGGGPVSATRIGGPLTVSTEGGSLLVDGLSGALHADTFGGNLTASGVDAAAATISTDGGDTQIAFAGAPQQVTVSTDGGQVALTAPGGPYALTVDSNGGPESVGIATNPAARASITIASGGGQVQVEPLAPH